MSVPSPASSQALHDPHSLPAASSSDGIRQRHRHGHRRGGGPPNQKVTASPSTVPHAVGGDPHNGVPVQTVPARGTARAGSLNLRPASVAPPEQTPAAAKPVHTQRGGARARGGQRGRASQHSVVETRQFGGSLTSGAPQSPQTTTPALQAHAAEFMPGQKYEPSNQPPPPAASARRAQPTRKRRESKSSAPDLGTRVHEDIDFGQYECAICTSEVLRKSKVWSCHTCWTVFHLDCIKRWSSNAGAASQQSGNNPTQSETWRCPGCNLPQDTKPRSYLCWCGKEHEPRSITGIPPHSCGQTCGKSRMLPKKCPHPCELLCHAGPCPPCTHIGPTQRCFCGKEALTRRCVDTQYESGWSCSMVCGDVMPCGEHDCPRGCHEGLCGACEVRIDARCYCGKEEKQILCCDKNVEEHSERVHLSEDGTNLLEDWIGLFECSNICGRPFDCGKHTCQRPCHVSEGEMTHCPRSPDLVTHCPCGKTLLEEITRRQRESCEESIPNCSKTCSKSLPCEHLCQQKCHIGDCMPCLQRISINCRCGRTASTTICHQGMEESPQCTRVCKTTLNCGRHECGERCCTGERKATERQTSKRRQRPLNAPRPVDDGFEAEHICTRVCGRTLKCGTHFCEELCHKGPCGACREAIFEEISCSCGRTVLQPPLPCGTKPPPCRYSCERPKTCGHPQVQHNCHANSDSCPKCPFLVTKSCVCGKKTLKNQQCWFTDVRCGEVCGRKLKCGSHFCRKTCHRPGECEDHVSNNTCTQACGKPKRACSHPCEDVCHAPYPCKEDKPCSYKAIITCPCQHIKQEVRCNATSASTGNTAKALSCTDECARLERNRKLALALDIDPATHTSDHIPYSAETLTFFRSLDSKWLTDQEREFRVFAADPEERRLRFKPMPPTQRAFIHALAEDFGLDNESMDPEPHRHVAVFKTPRFVSAPDKTLRDCVRIQRTQARTEQADRSAALQQVKAAQTMRSNVAEEWNGFLLTNARFALTVDELDAVVRSVQSTSSSFADRKLDFNIQFLASGNVALKATLRPHPSFKVTSTDLPLTAEKQLHAALTALKIHLARAISSPPSALGSLQLATFDAHLNVLRRESDSYSAAGGGWSQVAAKGAAPRTLPTREVQGGYKGGFAVLGGLGGARGVGKEKEKARKKGKKEQTENDEVLEDWADAMEAQDDEQEERGDGGVERVQVEELLDGAAAPTALPERPSLTSSGASTPPTQARTLDQLHAEHAALDAPAIPPAEQSAIDLSSAVPGAEISAAESPIPPVESITEGIAGEPVPPAAAGGAREEGGPSEEGGEKDEDVAAPAQPVEHVAASTA